MGWLTHGTSPNRGLPPPLPAKSWGCRTNDGYGGDLEALQWPAIGARSDPGRAAPLDRAMPTDRRIPSASALDRIVLKILEQEVHVVQFVEESIVILKVKQAAVCLSLQGTSPQESGTIGRQFECRTRNPG
jgi:hypothetical protein